MIDSYLEIYNVADLAMEAIKNGKLRVNASGKA